VGRINFCVALNDQLLACLKRYNIELGIQLTGVCRATLELTFRSDNTRRAGVEACVAIVTDVEGFGETVGNLRTLY